MDFKTPLLIVAFLISMFAGIFLIMFPLMRSVYLDRKITLIYLLLFIAGIGFVYLGIFIGMNYIH